MMNILRALFSIAKQKVHEGVSDRVASHNHVVAKLWHDVDGLHARRYSTYEEYKEHQASKLAGLKLDEYSKRLRDELASRIKHIPEVRRGATVLCLGARLGSECQSFIELGTVAIGIDLNPGPGNRFVVTGDFHEVQYADRSFDAVYTNALDHAFDLKRVITEIGRVLKQEGVLIAEIVRGSKDEGGRGPGEFESMWWEHVDDVIARIERSGFIVRGRERFDWPWGGDQVVFVKRPEKSSND